MAINIPPSQREISLYFLLKTTFIWFILKGFHGRDPVAVLGFSGCLAMFFGTRLNSPKNLQQPFIWLFNPVKSRRTRRLLRLKNLWLLAIVVKDNQKSQHWEPLLYKRQLITSNYCILLLHNTIRNFH